MDPRSKVSEVMSRLVVSVRPEARLEEAARLLREYHVSGLPVVTPPEHLVGVLSERDIVRSLNRGTGIESPRGMLDLLLGSAPTKGRSLLDVCRRHLRRTRVSEAMSYGVVTVEPEFPIARAAALMQLHQVHRLPVLDPAGRLVGIVTRTDLLRAISGETHVARGALHPSPAVRPTLAAAPFGDA